MSDVTISEAGSGSTIGFGRALIVQLRWFWQRLWLWVVLATVLFAAFGAYVIMQIAQETTDSGGPALSLMIVATVLHSMLVLVGISWALSAWRDDPPKDRQYFWLHPVARTAHTIARGMAGGLWLLAVLVVITAVILLSMQIAFGSDAILGSARQWFYFFGGITLAYIAASIAPILSDRPVAWIVLIFVVILFADGIAQIREIEWLQDVVAWFKGGPYSFGTALNGTAVEARRAIEAVASNPELATAPMQGPAEADPGRALLIWLPISIAGYLGAAIGSRPR